jgi:hypothetical protein
LKADTGTIGCAVLGQDRRNDDGEHQRNHEFSHGVSRVNVVTNETALDPFVARGHVPLIAGFIPLSGDKSFVGALPTLFLSQLGLCARRDERTLIGGLALFAAWCGSSFTRGG